MTDKLIKGINEEKWRKFVALCKMKGAKVGSEVEKFLDDYIKTNLGKMLK